MRRVGICGASGMAGGEVLRLLARHPEMETVRAVSARHAGEPVWHQHPHLRHALGDMVFSSHEGEEFVYLLEGRLEFRSHERLEVLTPGDAIYFESDLSHAFRGLDNQAARAIVVVWNKP